MRNLAEEPSLSGPIVIVWKKITFWKEAPDELLVQVFLESHPAAPAEIVLDADTTGRPLHGHREGRFFHGYCHECCYPPPCIFCGEHVLCARACENPIMTPAWARPAALWCTDAGKPT